MSVDLEKIVITIPLEIYYSFGTKITKEFMDKYFELYDKYPSTHEQGFDNIDRYLDYCMGNNESISTTTADWFGDSFICYILNKKIVDKQYIIDHVDYFYNIYIGLNANSDLKIEFESSMKKEQLKKWLRNF